MDNARTVGIVMGVGVTLVATLWLGFTGVRTLSMEYTTGTVTDTEREHRRVGRRSRNRTRYVVEYFTEDGEAHDTSASQLWLRTGQQVPVYYSASSPETAIVGSLWQRSLYPCSVFVFGVGGAVATSLGLRKRRFS